MEKYDPQVAARVWQRVRPEQPEGPQYLLALIAAEQANAGAYLLLSRRLSEKNACRDLSVQARSHADSLRGIYALMTGEKAAVQVPNTPAEPAGVVLRRCYGSALRCLTAYDQHSGDPEYGPVFSRLAVQQREHCRRVAELLGRL